MENEINYSMIEEHNNLFRAIPKAGTSEEIREIYQNVKGFVDKYSDTDATGCKRLASLYNEQVTLLVNNANQRYEKAHSQLEAMKQEQYNFLGEEDYSAAVQMKTMQLLAQLPKDINLSNRGIVKQLLDDAISSGVVGSRAVLSLLNFLTTADVLGETLKQRALDGSKTDKQCTFEKIVKAKKDALIKETAEAYNTRHRLSRLKKI